ncbi:hypothetical protein CANMA_003010 [Candida margitis]|uniref:uncharacterized protein n=1 Tax=Candida margitis TaxID=1775924 RepID=UPI002227B66E|nr:uncharacterized protein CANMA_003010 [Candida margitis]KAI5967576.1 hypothetical protein CANMA_003010 [Candida margitis]
MHRAASRHDTYYPRQHPYPVEESSDDSFDHLQPPQLPQVNSHSSGHPYRSSSSTLPLLNINQSSEQSLPLPPMPSHGALQRDGSLLTHPYQSSSRTLLDNNNNHPSKLEKQESTQVNDFEMSDFSRQPMPALDREQDVYGGYRNPFIENASHQSATDLPERSTTNPFDVNDEYIPEPSRRIKGPEYDLEKKMRHNERNRLRTLRSKPRFHYTKLPYFTMVVTLIQIIVFIVELAKMAILTGSGFQTKPYFNPMLGPSTYLFIYMGARYVPCMHQIKGVTDDTSILFPCANSTSEDTYTCSLSDLCGLSGLPTFDDGEKYAPNQWYRVFIPIFLHAGFLHIIFNLLLQLTMGASIERNIGILKYAIIYIASGISGFLLGANFTPQGIASTGASGALFGVVATNIILFIYTGRKNTNMYGTTHYKLFIFFMVCEIIISLVLGLLPGLDNFSHLGGFAMGILTAILLLKDPFWVYKDGIITYAREPTTWQQFVNNWNPMFAYEDKLQIPFLLWCGARVVALALIIVYFVLLCKNFFNDNYDSSEHCKWCKYFNCIPVKGWCDIGEVTVTSGSSTPTGSSSTAHQTTVPTEVYSTAVYTTNAAQTTSDSSNSEGSNGGFKRQLDAFEASPVQDSSRQVTSGHFSQQFGVGVGLYLTITLLTVAFMKKKKLI